MVDSEGAPGIPFLNRIRLKRKAEPPKAVEEEGRLALVNINGPARAKSVLEELFSLSVKETQSKAEKPLTEDELNKVFPGWDKRKIIILFILERILSYSK